MNSTPADLNAEGPRVRPVGPPGNLAVFNCRVLVSGDAASHEFAARVGNLAGIHAQGASQREALQGAVAAFKVKVAHWHERGEPIPWIEPSEKPRAGEREYFVAVHL